MAQINSREIVLLQPTTATASGNGVDINIPMGYLGAMIALNVTAASGTSPTLNVFVQNKFTLAAVTDLNGQFPLGTGTYDDLAAFAQMTTTGTRVFRILQGFGSTENALTQAALTAASARTGPIGDLWRVAYNIGGTSPSFTFSVTAKLIPGGQ